MNQKQLQTILLSTPEVAQAWLEPLQAAFERWDIATPQRQAAFLAQVSFESVRFTRLEENLDYSAAALLRQWGNRFTRQLAYQYGRTGPQHPANQIAIANIAYANRYGNGDIATGDGWKYRGRGLIQLTFHDNYRDAGVVLAHDFLSNPDDAASPEWAPAIAGHYWYVHGCNQMADKGNFEGITRAINGGLTGYQQRLALLGRVQGVLKNDS